MTGGLQRLNLAILSTRMTPEHRKMLRRARGGENIAGSDRKDDRVKQFLRREGLLVFDGVPRRWRITALGTALIDAESMAMQRQQFQGV